MRALRHSLVETQLITLCDAYPQGLVEAATTCTELRRVKIHLPDPCTTDFLVLELLLARVGPSLRELLPSGSLVTRDIAILARHSGNLRFLELAYLHPSMILGEIASANPELRRLVILSLCYAACPRNVLEFWTRRHCG